MTSVEISPASARELTDRIKVAMSQYISHQRPEPTAAKRVDNRKVYAILAWRSRMVKIGVAADPKHRLATIKTMSPEPLELIAVSDGGGRAIEGHLHRNLDTLRDHGEWFHLTPELMEILMGASS